MLYIYLQLRYMILSAMSLCKYHLLLIDILILSSHDCITMLETFETYKAASMTFITI